MNLYYDNHNWKREGKEKKVDPLQQNTCIKEKKVDPLQQKHALVTFF